jgi:hypothetical protein
LIKALGKQTGSRSNSGSRVLPLSGTHSPLRRAAANVALLRDAIPGEVGSSKGAKRARVPPMSGDEAEGLCRNLSALADDVRKVLEGADQETKSSEERDTKEIADQGQPSLLADDDASLEKLAGAAGQLANLSRALGSELDAHVHLIDGLDSATDHVRDTMETQARLSRVVVDEADVSQGLLSAAVVLGVRPYEKLCFFHFVATRFSCSCWCLRMYFAKSSMEPRVGVRLCQ